MQGWRLKSLALSIPIDSAWISAVSHQSRLTSLGLNLEQWVAGMKMISTVLPQLPLLTALQLEGHEPDEGDDEWEASTWNIPSVLTSLTIKGTDEFQCRLPLPIIASAHLQCFHGVIRASAAATLLRNSPFITDVHFNLWRVFEVDNDEDDEYVDEKFLIDAFNVGAGRQLQHFHVSASFRFSLPFVDALTTAANSALRKVHLDLQNETTTAGALVAFAQRCPNLQDLYLWRDEACRTERVEVLSIFPALHTLHLHLVTATLLEAVRGPAVTKLQIVGFRGDPAAIFQSFPALRMLNYNTFQGARPIDRLAPMTGAPVNSLIHSLSVSPDDLGLAVMARCRNVSWLGLHHAPARANFLYALSVMPQLATVTAVSCAIEFPLLSQTRDFTSQTADLTAALDVLVAAVVAMIGAMPRLKHATLGFQNGPDMPLIVVDRTGRVLAPNDYHPVLLKGLAPFVARGLEIRQLFP